METNSIDNLQEEEQSFSIKEFLTVCAAKWQWFICSLIFFLGIGTLYVLRQQPVYSRSCAVLIQDQDGGGGGVADIANVFSSMGLGSSKSSVNNELIALTSPAIMFEVVERLDLSTNYSCKETFYWKTLYGNNLPVTVTFDDLGQTLSGGFRYDMNPDGSGVLYKFSTYDNDGKRIKFDDEIKLGAGFDRTVKTPIGKITIKKNPAFNGELDETKTLGVSHGSLQGTVESYCSKLEGSLVDNDAEVIDLSIDDVSIQRANDILNTVIAVYNENWVENKNRIAIATSAFIGERLGLIEKELSDVDDDISDFKTKNLLSDPVEAASIVMNQSARQTDEIFNITNQLAMANYIKEYITDQANHYQVIPVNTGFGSPTLESQIATYNTLLLSRNNLADNSSTNNPVVKDYDVQLSGMREAIVKAVGTQIATLSSTLRNMQKNQGTTQHQMAAAPGQAKYLISVGRQQMVKEALYVFLLQKREENELSQTFTAYNTRIITPPYGPMAPISPKTTLILTVMFVLGLGLPAAAIYIIQMSDTKIRNRRELDGCPVPFTGEIPYVGKSHSLLRLLKTRKQKQAAIDKPLIVVEEGNRNAINESFRLIRSNLQMMNGKNHSCNVIMLTSFNPGSGKSFIAYNLGLTFDIKKKRVLLIDCDLRHGSLSMYVNSPSKGLSNYLNETTDDWRKLIVHVEGHECLDVLPIGHRPPNPAELLENGRLGDLLTELRKDYEYIFVDCPPIDIVVDTQVVDQYIDRTIFVVRAGLLDRNLLPAIAQMYHNKKYKRMSMILNGVEHSSGKSYYGEYYSAES